MQIAAAVLLGLLIPGAMIRLSTGKPEIKSPEPTVSESIQENTSDSGFWVLSKDGIVQWMDEEEYLTGVLLAEMPTSYHHQALCAQAVAARTYAMRRSLDSRHPQGAVCTDPGCCQAYVSIAQYLVSLGYAEDVVLARKAVKDTADLVITYEENVIEATYFHSSGGRTEDAVAVWGVEIPYLQAVDSPGEEDLEAYSCRKFYSTEELEQLLERSLPGTPASWLGWTTYTVGGGVETMLLAGVQYTGLQLRGLLGLNSTAFSVEAEPDGLWFTAMGKGHRVGLSQNGAQAMALRGHSWQKILLHYYPGTGIDKMEDVG